MAVTCGFFNALDHDRLYDAIQMSSIFDGIIRDGVFSTIGTSMVVTAPENGMVVNVGAGRAWFNHTWILNDTLYPVEAEAAEVVLDRIDAVVIEVNSSAEVRDCTIKFIKGEPSSQPNRPTMTHNAEVNQYALAYVRIRAGQTTIFQADITNAVGTDETPFITGILQQISAEQLILEWEAEFNDHFHNWEVVNEAAYTSWTTNMQNQYTAWMQAKMSDYQTWYAAMQAEGQEDLAEFDAWFQTMKDQLSEDAAGHLQAEIDALSADAEKGSVLTITTPNASLHGRTCTVYQGSSANGRTATFDNNGVAEFPSIPWVGNVSISATDGSQTATSIINIPYFGRYSQEIAFWAATVNIETTSTEFYGETITVEKDGSLIGSLQFDNTGHATYTATSPGVYTFTVTYDGVDYDSTVNVINKTTYNTIIDAWTATLNMDATLTPELYGRAVTIAKGGITVGTTAFDNTGHATFKVHEAGTYTVTSTTAGGSEFTTQVVVTEETAYEVDLGTPNGATATPTDNIQVWLKCGSEYSYNYTTIAQVLHDTELFARLCGDSNACDYMARSTTWADDIAADATAMQIVGMFDYCSEALLSNATWAEAIANSAYTESVFNIKVPKMTGATTPSGEAGATGTIAGGGYEPWKAFSGKPDTDTSSNGWVPNAWGDIGWYKFTSPQTIKYAKIRLVDDNHREIKNTVQVYASNDNSTWTPIGSSIVMSGTNVWDDVILNNDTAYQYWGFKIINSTSGHTASNGYGYRMQFYGRASSKTYVPLVPTMTSNTTPSGVAFASSIHNDSRIGCDAWNCMDGNQGTIWHAKSDEEIPQWVGYKFNTPTRCDHVRFEPAFWDAGGAGYNGSRVKQYKIQASNDNTNWIDLTEVLTNPYNNYDSSKHIVDSMYVGLPVEADFTKNIGSYLYYRLYVIDTYTNYKPAVCSLQFYTSEGFVTIHSAANDTIYYLDGSTPINVAVTDATGKGQLDKTTFDPGNHTLYSTVAKNPVSLSNDYSKSVKITKYTKEIYLMPIGAIYWYGWESSLVLSDLLSRMTYSWRSGAINPKTLNATENTNNIVFDMVSGGSSHVSQEELTGVIDLSHASHAKSIISVVNSQYARGIVTSGPWTANPNISWQTTPATLAYDDTFSDNIFDVDISAINSGVIAYMHWCDTVSNKHNTLTLSAAWLE